jgi:arsenate reductase (thioredoxin)
MHRHRARSQMAEGLLRHLAGDRFEAFSAGTKPKGLSPTTIQVMREVGIDVSKHRSKSVDEFRDQEFDYLVTLCDSARTECRTLARAKQMLHWDIRDPADLENAGISSINAFRSARDELQIKIEKFADSNLSS